MKTFEEIQAMCVNDEYLSQILRSHLNLIKTVEENFKHIIELEALINLFKGGLPKYYKEYRPEQEEIVQFCALVAENTRANHYRDQDKFDDVYVILAAL